MGYSMPSLVRFEQLLDPMKNTIFENKILEIIANFRMKNKLFSEASYTKNSFCLRFYLPLILATKN